jgi:hypothetical protein
MTAVATAMACGYVCCRYSEALLVLLRQFSKSGALVPTAVNPDGLQQEIQELLDTANLNSYYAAVSRGCEHTAQRGLQTAAEATTDVTDAATGVTQVKVGHVRDAEACMCACCVRASAHSLPPSLSSLPSLALAA